MVELTKKKLVIIPEAVDVDYFDPDCYSPTFDANFANFSYIFLSVFKWEERKGWRILIQSFLEEFQGKEGVLLYVLSRPRGKENPVKEINTMRDNFRAGGATDLPPIAVHSGHMHVAKIPVLYKSVDAFVLPSKGEGWGRPQVEMMAMGKPTIATFWSGPTEFMTEENSYPLKFTQLEDVDKSLGPGIKGHKWAVPSKDHLKQLMRHLVQNPEEGRKKGQQAREDMRKYSILNVSLLVRSQIEKAVSKFVTEKAGKHLPTAEPKIS